MGINARVYDLMSQFCKRTTPGQALVAGYPDIDFKTLLTAPQLFECLGYTMEAIDYYAEQGSERIVDLNHPIRVYEGNNQYDLVLDHGTIEHCFNIGVAARNLADAVALDGFMVQHLPANMHNHGFYNISPTWFYDFYKTNKFEILHFEGWCGETKQSFRVPMYDQFKGLPEMSLYTMIAQRREVKEIVFPLQYKYSQPPEKRNVGTHNA